MLCCFKKRKKARLSFSTIRFIFFIFCIPDVLEKVEERFSLSIPSSLEISFVHLNDYSHFLGMIHEGKVSTLHALEMFSFSSSIQKYSSPCRSIFDDLDRATRLSLLVESWGTMRLAYKALELSTPSIFFDTTGCAFTYVVAKVLFGCKVIAYVHYPTISTDMLSMVWERRRATYNNQASITGSRIKTAIKLIYYSIFACLYGIVGSLCDLVFVNSTWTFNHINSLWCLVALQRRIRILFPPCRISTPNQHNGRQEQQSNKREKIVLSIGQFRPEKDHELQIESVSLLFKNHPELKGQVKLVLVGGCRGPSDEERLGYLKTMTKKLGLEDSVVFSVNQPYSVVEDWLRRASVGIHTMWNEHFGIGVVEMMSAGLITIAHDSGGPKSDIIVPQDGQPTGLLASSAEAYSDALYQAFTMNAEEAAELRRRAQSSATRFSDEQFVSSFKKEILESRILS